MIKILDTFIKRHVVNTRIAHESRKNNLFPMGSLKSCCIGMMTERDNGKNIQKGGKTWSLIHKALPTTSRQPTSCPVTMTESVRERAGCQEEPEELCEYESRIAQIYLSIERAFFSKCSFIALLK